MFIKGTKNELKSPETYLRLAKGVSVDIHLQADTKAPVIRFGAWKDLERGHGYSMVVTSDTGFQAIVP